MVAYKNISPRGTEVGFLKIELGTFTSVLIFFRVEPHIDWTDKTLQIVKFQFSKLFHFILNNNFSLSRAGTCRNTYIIYVPHDLMNEL